MIEKLLSFASPYMLWVKLASYGVVLVLGLYGGYKLTSNHYKAKEVAILEAAITEAKLQEIINREVVVAYQANIKNLDEKYNKLKGKLHATSPTNVPCTLTSDAVKLWNDSLSKEVPVSKDTTGTTTGGTATITEALDNKLSNDKASTINRERLEAIIEWDKKHFGD